MRNERGEVEVLDRHALTIAAGEHPLFAGVQRLIVTGLAEEPELETKNERVELSVDGITASFEGAVVERLERRILLHLD